MKSILFTGEELNSRVFKGWLGEESAKKLLHIPLEKTEFFTFEEEEKAIDDSLSEYTFTIYGGLRNAVYFMQYVTEKDLMDQVKNHIHLVTDKPTQEFLESHSIPAILPRENAKGIDVLEFLLRISTQGTVLYPATDQHVEEIPGLLNELKMGVTEFTVCRERSLTSDELVASRETVTVRNPDAVIFHDRASVNRIRIAFPDLPLDQIQVISASRGVTGMLHAEGIEVDEEAGGSWYSLSQLVTKLSSE